jgi:hypothetical protein
MTDNTFKHFFLQTILIEGIILPVINHCMARKKMNMKNIKIGQAAELFVKLFKFAD